MTLGRRLSVLVTATVAVSLVCAAVVAWFLMQSRLRSDVDAELVRQANVIARTAPPPGGVPVRLPLLSPMPGSPSDLVGPGPYLVPSINLINTQGEIMVAFGSNLPISDADRAVAANGGVLLRDTEVAGARVRMATVQASGGRAAVVSRSVDDVDRTIRATAWWLAGIVAAGVALAAGLSRLIARVGLRPVHALAHAAGDIARTQDTSAVLPVSGRDEVAALSRALNTMLTALDDARARHRRLVDDAGHELRTPLASLRANVELLERAESGRPLAPIDRHRLIGDARAQAEELSDLVSNLVAVARDGTATDDAPSRFDFGELVAGCAARARRIRPDVSIRVNQLPTWWVFASRNAVERAVTNVLDNAVKFSPTGGQVRASLVDGTLSVDDDGPGIAADDRAHVFERFFRAASARSLPGSGLGLAIAREALTAAGGTVEVAPTAKGTRVLVTLPRAEADS